MSVHNTEKSIESQSDEGRFIVQKQRGETLATLVKRFRELEGYSESLPITYAGRLDPMAEGAMMLFVGDACKRKERYLGLDKTYEYQILFGVATDTFDMLGCVEAVETVAVEKEALKKVLTEFIGFVLLPYPPYASKPVDGVPLFMRARAGTLPEVLPVKEGIIYEHELLSLETTTLGSVVSETLPYIHSVEGDFRQEEILKQWEPVVSDNRLVYLATCKVRLSSGLYVRSLAVEIGKRFGVPALAYRIIRTSF